VRLLCLIDECTREALADVLLMRGVVDQIRSDNGLKFTAKALRAWLATVGAKTRYIEPGRQ
jgi:transposase InsO family protein